MRSVLDDINLEREAERLQAKHPNAEVSVDEIGEVLAEEVLRNVPDEDDGVALRGGLHD